MCLNFIKLVGSKERLQKKKISIPFSSFPKPYWEPSENTVQASVSSVNGEWMPKGSEVKSKNNGLP